jgi:hypothetical protein
MQATETALSKNAIRVLEARYLRRDASDASSRHRANYWSAWHAAWRKPNATRSAGLKHFIAS